MRKSKQSRNGSQNKDDESPLARHNPSPLSGTEKVKCRGKRVCGGATGSSVRYLEKKIVPGIPTQKQDQSIGSIVKMADNSKAGEAKYMT